MEQNELVKKYIKGLDSYTAIHFNPYRANDEPKMIVNPSSADTRADDGVKFSDRYCPSEKEKTFNDVLREQYERFRGTGETELLSLTLNKMMSETFSDMLCRYAREKDLSSAEIYKKAQIDRRLYSKIISDKEYQPSKDTAVALALSLGLSESEARTFLASAGYTLSPGNKRDVMLAYFFTVSERDVFLINEVLDALDQKPLGK